jgi:hypothetical protein
VSALGRRALRQSAGDWRRSEDLFQSYLQGVENRLTHTGSRFGTEWQPAALVGGERVPAFIYREKLDGSGLVHDRWGNLKLEPYPSSRRLDAGIVDRSDPSLNKRVLSGFDITLNTRKPSITKYYQEAFGPIEIFDIGLGGLR